MSEVRGSRCGAKAWEMARDGGWKQAERGAQVGEEQMEPLSRCGDGVGVGSGEPLL